jgi:tetratricopeptide (TPR) repeat protein
VREGFAALEVARKRKATDQYKRAIDAFEAVLTDDPGNGQVKPPLDEARREYRALVGEIGEAQLGKLTEQCKAIYNQGVSQQAKRTAPAYQQAIKTFERVTRSQDPDGRTPYYQQSQSAIAAAKRKLRELASPLREEGKKFSTAQDWLRARVALRKAVATDPFDQTLQDELENVQQECVRNAKRQISEAKAYEAAVNYPEALKAADLALKYADRDTDKENQQIKEIIKRIRRNSER